MNISNSLSDIKTDVCIHEQLAYCAVLTIAENGVETDAKIEKWRLENQQPPMGWQKEFLTNQSDITNELVLSVRPWTPGNVRHFPINLDQILLIGYPWQPAANLGLLLIKLLILSISNIIFTVKLTASRHGLDNVNYAAEINLLLLIANWYSSIVGAT